jgi:hypothetical protein
MNGTNRTEPRIALISRMVSARSAFIRAIRAIRGEKFYSGHMIVSLVASRRLLIHAQPACA